MKKKELTPEQNLRKIKRAVKNYCLACSGDSKTEAEKCPIKECPLWDYRK